MVRGADPTVSYAVDGVVTTPMKSALSRGDVNMALTLLNSRAVRVHAADLESAPLIRQDLITPQLVKRLSIALVDDGRRLDNLTTETEQQPASSRQRRGGSNRKPEMASLAHAVREYNRNGGVKSDHTTLAPPSLAATTSEDEDDSDQDEEDDDTTTTLDEDPDLASSDASTSAGDDDDE